MSNTDTRTLLERACAKAVDTMLTGDDVATVRQATGHHVVVIRTVESDEREARTAQRREEHAERARDEVGIQLAAAQAEIARMRPVVEAARRLLWSWDEGSTATERSRQHEDIRRALRALDTVSGDALAPRINAALEASGIDTDNTPKAKPRAEVVQWEKRAEKAWSERDAALSTMLTLTAEVEAMRAVVEAVNAAQDEADNGTGNGFGHYCDAVEKARALRARKVGG